MGYLADIGPDDTPVVGALEAQLPEGPFRDRHAFARLDVDGAVRETFGIQKWSIDDELGASFHAVVGDTLCELTVREFSCDPFRTELDQKPLLHDLVEISPRDVSALVFVRAALAAHRRDRRVTARK